MISDQDTKHWYVLRALFHGEEKVRDLLRGEGIQCYVPMDYRVQTIRQRKVRRLVPAVSELVFVNSSLTVINDFKRRCNKTVYLLTRPSAAGPDPITVADKDMENFIRITQQHEREVTYFQPQELPLSKGDHIQILGGLFHGVEGILLKIKGKREKQLVVTVPGIAAATVNIQPDLVQLKSKKIGRSNNLSGDTKELLRLTTQMLLSPPDHNTQVAEWDMLYFEIKRLYESLKHLRGFLPVQEGELSLSLLMAEKVLSEIQPTTIQRFRKALSILGERTLLCVRMQWIGGTLLQDNTLICNAQDTITRWLTDGPSFRQQALIEDSMLWKNLLN